MTEIIDSVGPDGRRALRFIGWDEWMAEEIQPEDWIIWEDEPITMLEKYVEKIRALEFTGNKANGLASLNALERIYYRSIDPFDFRRLPCLKDIWMECTKKTSLEIFNIQSLLKIDLIDLPAKNLSFLSAAINIKAVRFLDSSLISLSGIENLQSIVELKIQDAKNIANIGSIIHCSNIESLELAPCPKLRDISPVYKLSKMKYLFIQANFAQQEGIEWIANMPCLEVAYIWVETKMVDWDLVASHSRLWEFYIFLSKDSCHLSQSEIEIKFRENRRVLTKFEMKKKKDGTITIFIQLETLEGTRSKMPGYIYMGHLRYQVPIGCQC